MSIQSYLLSTIILCLTSVSQIHATENPRDIDQVLERLVKEHTESTDLVGLGAIMVLDGKIIGPSVSGERKIRSHVSLANTDQWHIGSITKSFTATLIARLVERGELNWDTSIKEIFSDVKTINQQWHSVTLHQLLTHTSGATPNFPLTVSFKNPAEGLERMMARESAVVNILKKPPTATPGSTFVYSNVGYTIAGVIAEKQTGLSWEELIRKEIFAPLHLQSAGFGPPQDKEKELEQPRGHKKILGLTVSVGTQGDNTPIIGPAGTIHLSLQDLALYGTEHLKGVQGHGTILKAETFQRLHKPVLDNYAYGWSVSSPDDFGVETLLWHNGSNTMWYAMLAIVPDINAVIAVTSNDGNIAVAETSAKKIIKKLIRSVKNNSEN